MPTSRSPGASASVTSSNRPPRLASSALCGGSGYWPGRTRPPMNRPEPAVVIEVGGGHGARR